MSRLDNRLRPARLAAGLSQERLARVAGISRQAYASIEAGRSVPSTEVALRVARALMSTVESLFSLPLERGDTVVAELIPGKKDTSLPSRVQLVTVGDRLLARPLVGRRSAHYSIAIADGIATGLGKGQKVSVELMAPLEEALQLVIVGGDPSINLLGRDLRSQGFGMVWFGEDSSTALDYLIRGNAHVAGCHLFDEAAGEYNLPWVEKLVPFSCTVVTFAIRQQGLIVAEGNPKGITTIVHLTRPDVAMVNREVGSGSRALLDRLMGKAGVPEADVIGYGRVVDGHLPVADAVASGLADAGIGVQSVAEARGLGFVPLGEERYDFVIPDHFLHLPMVQAFLETLRRPYPRRQIEALGGYDVAPMGLPVTA
ncbi:MAG: substrate-binding domain-containing protein [Dehalococcoidia bacterium]